MENQEQVKELRVNTITPIVQGIEQLQKLRIQTGNRIAAINIQRRNQAVKQANTEEDKEKIQKEFDKVLEVVQKEYRRITDSIVEANYKTSKKGGVLPTPKKFQPSDLINTYSELILVDQYVRLLENEKMNIAQLDSALQEIPLYTDYLCKVGGVGPKIAGVIVSEIDWERTKYVNSLHAYAGLDTVIYGVYKNKDGQEVRVSFSEICAYYEDKMTDGPMEINGYPVEFRTKGRGRDNVSLVTREYKKSDGSSGVRNSITFNPFLKTKLIGVLGPSFLKQSMVLVDGEKMSTEQREEMAVRLGCKLKGSAAEKKAEVIAFLRDQGFDVVVQRGRFAKVYYDYKHRIENSNKPEHQGLSSLHIHNMAVRYMVKEFLRELYVVGRHLAGLPIYSSYESAKLGYNHCSNNAIFKEFNIDPSNFKDNETEWLRDNAPRQVKAYLAKRETPAAILNP